MLGRGVMCWDGAARADHTGHAFVCNPKWVATVTAQVGPMSARQDISLCLGLFIGCKPLVTEADKCQPDHQ